MAGDWSDGTGVGLQGNTKFFQNPGCNGSGGNSADGLTSRGTSAASVVAKTIFTVKTKICMSRAIGLRDISVIPGTLVFVPHDHGNGGASGLSLKDSGKDFDFISFISGSGVTALARLPSVQISLYICLRKEKSCWNAIYNGAQCLAVGLSPGSYCKFFSKC